jgi:hypothetical protein
VMYESCVVLAFSVSVAHIQGCASCLPYAVHHPYCQLLNLPRVSVAEYCEFQDWISG